MAHDCPVCWMQCHCLGDIDDINFGEKWNCIHCDGEIDDEDDDFNDEEKLIPKDGGLYDPQTGITHYP